MNESVASEPGIVQIGREQDVGPDTSRFGPHDELAWWPENPDAIERTTAGLLRHEGADSLGPCNINGKVIARMRD
jgi:hypothetical protein